MNDKPEAVATIGLTVNDAAETVAPMPKRKPNVVAVLVRVPAGHELPLGGTIQQPFDLTVNAGARWFPGWDGPRISVMAYRVMAQGDAIGFAGEKAAMFPLPDAIKALADRHGKPVEDKDLPMLDALGLALPTEPEKYEAFAVIRPLGVATN